MITDEDAVDFEETPQQFLGQALSLETDDVEDVTPQNDLHDTVEKHSDHHLTKQGTIDSQSETKVEEEDTSIQMKQLYLLVARCIAFPFNAKPHLDTAPPKPKLNCVMYEKICDVLQLCADHDKSLQNALILTNNELKCIRNQEYLKTIRWYICGILKRHDVMKICCRGGFSARELENIFRVAISRQFRDAVLSNVSSSERLSKRIENDPKFQVWVSTFSKLLEHGRQLAMSEEEKKIVIRKQSLQGDSKESLYSTFQSILGISRSYHKKLYLACQLDSKEEQERVMRRELQKRNELLETSRPVFYEEGQRSLRTLTQNLQNVTAAIAGFGITQSKKNRKPQATESSGKELTKSDVLFHNKVKVTVRNVTRITISDEKPVFVVFELIDGDKILTTDTKKIDMESNVSFDITGEFWSKSPLPQIKFQFKVFTQGLLKDDKLIGKCIHTVMPTKSETTDNIPIIQHNDKIVGYLRVSTFLERPDNMRKCGNLFCSGDYVFKEWKQRFLSLILLSQLKFILCFYQPKDTHPKEFIPLEGWTVDYLTGVVTSDTVDLDEDLPYRFELTSSKGRIMFACKTHSEREAWVRGLFRATGQASTPMEETERAVGNNELKESGLSEVINMDVFELDHQELFSKLFKAMLDHRLSEPVFSRGMLSSGQMFVLDEYCARYCVRLSHRHLTCLWEWLNCELRGISIWPVMMLHSFGFCQMHVLGKAPQLNIEVVTSKERKTWTETSDQIEILLTEKLENFCCYFPFSCPKEDLKITMKLYNLVTGITHAEGTAHTSTSTMVSASESTPTKLLNSVMERAALINYKNTYDKLLEEDNDEVDSAHLSVDRLYVLAQLCVDFMYELHEFYFEDFSLYPQAFTSHVDAFWSFFMVDLKETLDNSTDDDVVSLLKMFYSLNEYLCLQPTLKLSQFHQNVLKEFEPLVEGYLNRLNLQMKSDMLAFFKQETWMPVSECCFSMQGCLEALESIKKFIEQLHWPQEPFAGDIVFKVQSICAEKFEEAVRFTRQQCDLATNSLSINFTSLLPKPIVTMVNTIMYLSVQAVPFCGLKLTDERAIDQESNLASELHSFLETNLGDIFRMVISKLCEPFEILLKQMAKYDPSDGMLSSLKVMLPGKIQTEHYCLFLKMNFQHLSGTLVTAVFTQFMMNWYETQLRLLVRWLRNRPDFSLDQAQLAAIPLILEGIREVFQDDDIEEEQLNTESYEEIEDRLKIEHSQAVVMKAFKK